MPMTDGQTLDVQVAQLRAAGAERVLQETISGANRDRAHFQMLLDRLEPKDVLLMTRLDRLVLSTRNLLNIFGAIMTPPDDNPFGRALSVLTHVQGQAMDAHFVAAFEEIRTALLDAVAEREALLDASRKAMRLIDALDNFEAAQDDGSEKLLLRRADVVEAAEGALVDALNRIADRLQDKDARQ